MSSTVQLQMLKFAQIVDPRDKDDNVFALATATGYKQIGTADGDKFTAQRLLDMYNDARMLAAQVISERLGARAAQEVSENLIRTTVTITSGVLAKPTGYIFPLTLLDAAGKVISILPAEQIPFKASKDCLASPIMFEENTQFRSENGSTYIPNASTYVFRYIGISQFVLATDVTNLTPPLTQETFSPFYEPVLIQIAAAIATSQGLQKPTELARQLIQIDRDGHAPKS